MTNTLYTINLPTIVGSSINSFNIIPDCLGNTNITFSLSCVDTTISNIRKLVIEFYDGFQYVFQPTLTGSDNIFGQTISYMFPTTLVNPTTYTVCLTGIRNDLTFDIFNYAVSVYQSALSSTNNGYLSLVNITPFDTDKTLNNLLLSIEAISSRQLSFFVLSGYPLQ